MSETDLNKMKTEVSREHRWAMAQRVGLISLLLSIVAGIGVLAVRDHYRGQAVEQLGSALNAQRDQLTYCQSLLKSQIKQQADSCDEPVSPSASKVIEGVRGPVGPIGPIGPSGPPGTPGLIGPRGIQGIPGIQGPRGIQGERGLTGKSGQDGKPGEPGSVGPEGPTGPQGATGATGPQGERGQTGEDGQDAVPFAFLFTIPANNPMEEDRTYRCVIQAPSETFTCMQVNRQ